MKILIAIVLLALTACRTTGKLVENESQLQRTKTGANMKWQYDQQSYGSYRLDTSSTYWHLQTDAPFYYHPDAGLYAQQGVLSIINRHGLVDTQGGNSTTTVLGKQDSAVITTIMERDMAREVKREMPWKQGLVVVVLAVSAAIVIFGWRR